MLPSNKAIARMARFGATRVGTFVTFIFWCDFAGVGDRQPSEVAIRAEFVAAGVPELCPGEDFWDLLRREPGYPWIPDSGGGP
jgi:hypothetical protein